MHTDTDTPPRIAIFKGSNQISNQISEVKTPSPTKRIYVIIWGSVITSLALQFLAGLGLCQQPLHPAPLPGCSTGPKPLIPFPGSLDIWPRP